MYSCLSSFRSIEPYMEQNYTEAYYTVNPIGTVNPSIRVWYTRFSSTLGSSYCECITCYYWTLVGLPLWLALHLSVPFSEKTNTFEGLREMYTFRAVCPALQINLVSLSTWNSQRRLVTRLTENYYYSYYCSSTVTPAATSESWLLSGFTCVLPIPKFYERLLVGP